MTNRGRALLLSWCCLVVAVTVLSLLPGSMVPQLPTEASTGHFLAYLGLAAIPAAGIQRLRAVWLAILSSACLGVALEFMQIWIPGRTFEWSDILANSMGVTAGMVAGLLLRLRLIPEADRDIPPLPHPDAVPDR